MKYEALVRIEIWVGLDEDTYSDKGSEDGVLVIETSEALARRFEDMDATEIIEELCDHATIDFTRNSGSWAR